MICEVEKIVSGRNDVPNKYVVHYISGRKREYFDPLPKTVRNFITDKEPKYESCGDYYRYTKRR